jgi:superfamily II DNA/RNA helicase
MPTFEKGQRVSSKRHATQKGRVNNILNSFGGHQFCEVLWDNGSVESIAEHELQNEKLISTPWDLLETNSLKDYRDFTIATTLHKVRNTTSNTISTLQASRTIFMPYQYKPLVKFLKSEIKRILIADEVGLGKTIEAGHIMLELAARGNLNNVLVVCTNSLKDKWQTELQDKFNFVLKIYETTKDLIQDIKNDNAHYKKSIFGIVNYEKLRTDDFQEALEQSPYHFDLLICDEAHKIRNSETLKHRAIAKVVDISDAVVFLTATPIMTDLTNLHNLIRVLDREGYDTYDIFYNAIQLNKPFIHAVKRLNANEPLKEIAEELNSTEITQEMTADRIVYSRFRMTVSEIFQKDELYQRACESMTRKEDTLENRVKIQQDLIELNSLNHLYTRTRKRDVLSDEDMVTRKARTIPVYLSDEEQYLYDSIIEEYDEEHVLALIQKKREISSSILAFEASREELEQGKYPQDIPDSKFNAFKTIIDEVVLRKQNKIIVFAFFTKTLLYLKTRLEGIGLETEIIYGGIKNRTERIEHFQNNPNIKVLLSSEVGSEGLDLQFCNALVNYDLPWNPMVVEQRIGRIDRVGQRSKVINIYNLILHDTIEERIHNRLYQRINLFEQSLGDLEEILGDTEPLGEIISRGIEELYKTKLTPKEQEDKLEQIRKAIENEKLNLQKVSTELQDAFANDLHFHNEIKRLTENNRYLTKEEIIQYIESIIRIHLSSLQIVHIDETISELNIPGNSKSLIFDFIEEYKDPVEISTELQNLYKKFRGTHYGERKITLTFDQKYAYRQKSVEHISAFHPLINAITNFYSKHGFDKNLAYKIAISKHHFAPAKALDEGYYILAIYKITVKKNYGDNKTNELQLLRTCVADLNEDFIKVFSSEYSDYIHGIVQTKGELFLETFPLNPHIVSELRNDITKEIINDQCQVEADEKVKFLSGIKRRTEQEITYINNRIHRINGMLSAGKGIEAILKNDREALNQKKERLLINQQNANLNVSNSLISVNLLKVI